MLAVGIGSTGYWTASQSKVAGVKEKFNAVLADRKHALSSYLGSIEQDMRSVASNPFTHSALSKFKAAWNELGGERTAALQRAYIEENPHPTGEKEKLDAAPSGSSYDAAHAKNHPWFRTFLRERDYYDIFLFDLDGNLVYSVFKELDYATNLVSDPWKDSDLGNAFRAGRDSNTAASLHFFDFKPYAPSHDAPANFISTPLFDGAGQKVGVLVFQMPIARINAVMTNSAGLGTIGETFIVGSDSLMRATRGSAKTRRSLNTKFRTAPSIWHSPEKPLFCPEPSTEA